VLGTTAAVDDGNSDLGSASTGCHKLERLQRHPATDVTERVGYGVRYENLAPAPQPASVTHIRTRVCRHRADRSGSDRVFDAGHL